SLPVTGSPHTITANYSDSIGTYDPSSGNTQHTVNRYAFTYNIGTDNQTYGSPVDLAADLGTTINTPVNGETLSISYSSSGDTNTAQVGGYDITGVIGDGSGLASDYNVTVNP